jgi:protein-tyrosine kinase
MSTIERAIEKLDNAAAQANLNVNLELETAAPASHAYDVSSSETLSESLRDSELSRDNRIKLDLNRLQAVGIVDAETGKSNPIAEEFRNIKRPLLMHALGQGATQVHNANLIMVTSSLANEGKTFTSINLAMSMAMEMDKTVLLIDADVAKPQIANRFGLTARKGLTDVLLDPGIDLADVLIRTDFHNLVILPSGRRHPRSTELLASQSMKHLTEELSTRYSDRIVIFDSPPMLITSEARVLAGLMGQIVMVVEESVTPQPLVKEALAMLQSNEIVGLVLNKTRRRHGSDYYGYGYYGYGQ